jgi:hypothetical protein
MTEDTSELQLTARELKLALKYGYPFPEQEEQLRNSQVINGMHVAHSIRIGSPCGSPTLSARPRRSVAKACSRNSTRSAMYWRPPSSRTLAYAVWFWSSLTLSTPHTQTTNLSTHPFRRSGPFVSGRRLMLIGRAGNRRRASGVEPRENENGRRDPGNQHNCRD